MCRDDKRKISVAYLFICIEIALIRLTFRNGFEAGKLVTAVIHISRFVFIADDIEE